MAIDGKIETLNNAIREAIPEMQRVAGENPNAQVLIRVVTFSDGAQWKVPTPTPIDSFAWNDLEADGLTDMGKALSLVAEQLKIPPMSDRALPPVIVLISDGQPTDDFRSGLNKLMGEPWGKRAVRIAIAIGRDADKDCLQKFIQHSELKPLEANNAENLTRFIKWASTVVVKSASSPASQSATSTTPTTDITDSTSASVSPTPPPPPIPIASSSSSGPDEEEDIW
jgi:uncharacterized protein YegL